jgi:hypothetical protein
MEIFDIFPEQNMGCKLQCKLSGSENMRIAEGKHAQSRS